MDWSQLIGHQQQLEWFQTAMAQNRLGSTFLFVGPSGVGKRTFARLMAQGLLCGNSNPRQLEFCGKCEDCAQVRASTHPDLIEVAKPKEKSEMPLDLLIGTADKRMREGLCYEISLRPFSGKRKIAIIDDADTLNLEGANALLKTLEEPPENSVLILIGTSLQRQLPTIRSRCQTILFRRLESAVLTSLLLRQQVVATVEEAAEITAHSGGSLSEAIQLNDPELADLRTWLWTELGKRPIDFQELSKHCSAHADAAGKEGRLKRERLKWIFRFAAHLYRQVVLMQFGQLGEVNRGMALGKIGGAIDTDPAPESRIPESFLRAWTGGLPAALACWQTCLLSMDQVDRNANQATLLQAWSAKIAEQSGC